MKVAIVHDYLIQYGGAEKVVEVFHELFPNAPIFTTAYSSRRFPKYFNAIDIRTSFIQSFPFLDKHFKKYLLFYPRAIESLDLRGYDLVLSSSSAFAKGAKKDDGACHVCYCHAPMRFVWDYKRYIQKEDIGMVTRKILPMAIKWLKKWDLKTVNRVDYYIANSEYIKDKIRQYYNRDATVINPPVNVKEFKTSDKIEDFFLIVSRLNAYKNIDLAIDAFNELGLKLKIVGSGPYRKILENMANTGNIEFLGRLSDEALKEVYSKCRAYIFPGEEDFGISPIEAQASGRPVIAYGCGGALETVVEGATGLFFKESSKDSLKEAVKNFMEMEEKFDKEIMISNALRFDKGIFKYKIKEFLNSKYKEFFKIK